MPWSTDDLKRLVEVEAQLQGVDPRLASALVSQESEWNPNAVGDNGNSIGLFQLQPGAAKDVGLHPRFRSDVASNVTAGITYLKQKLTQSGGNVEQALSRYNRGTPDYRGIGDPNYVQNVLKYYPDYQAQAQPPPHQQPGILSRAASMLSPASAEASTPPSAGFSRLQELEAELARRDQQAPPPVSQAAPPPQTQPGASQGPAMRLSLGDPSQAATAPEARATIEAMRQRTTQQTPVLERFLALPSIAQLTPAERQQVQAEFQALPPDQQAEVIQREVPQDLQQAMAQPPPPVRKSLGVPDEAPLEESLTAPSTMIPLLMPGAGAVAVTPLLKPVVKGVEPAVNRLLRPLAEGLSQTLGWGTGKTIETGQVPSAGELGTEAAWSIGVGGVLEGLGAAGQAVLRRSQAGKALVAADEATTAAQAEYRAAQAESQAAYQAAQAEQQAERKAFFTEKHQAAERRVRGLQAQYQEKVAARDATIAANQQTYQDALAAHRTEVQTKQAASYEQARAQTQEEIATAERARQGHVQAIAGQQGAITEARAIPGRYAPETPSWVLYEKYGDAAKDVVMDLTPAKGAVAELRAKRGVLPDGTPRPFPSQVESIAATLEEATGIEGVPFETIRQELRKLGPLTRSSDGTIRGPAKQLMGVYADVLDAAPVANDLLKQANATFRREMAVKDMDDWLKPGHGIITKDRFNRETIKVEKFFNKLDKTTTDDALFRGAFTPQEHAAIQADAGRLAGTPVMPRGEMPPAARPEYVPGAVQAPAITAAPTLKAPPRDITRPRPELLPAGGVGQAPERLRTPVEAPPPGEAPLPVTPRQQLGERPPFAAKAGTLGGILYALHDLGVPRVVTAPLIAAKALQVTAQQGRWLLANALLSEKGQRVVRAAIDDSGTLHPRVYGAIVAILTPGEKKAYERETRGQGR